MTDQRLLRRTGLTSRCQHLLRRRTGFTSRRQARFAVAARVFTSRVWHAEVNGIRHSPLEGVPTEDAASPSAGDQKQQAREEEEEAHWARETEEAQAYHGDLAFRRPRG